MTKIAIVDIDRVICDPTARFARADEAKTKYLKSNRAIQDGESAEKKSVLRHWKRLQR